MWNLLEKKATQFPKQLSQSMYHFMKRIVCDNQEAEPPKPSSQAQPGNQSESKKALVE